MKVAMVIEYLAELGGAQRQVQQLAPLLAKQHVEVEVVTRRLRGAGAAAEPHNGLSVREVPVPPGHAPASLAFTLGGSAALVRARPQVIHSHGLLSPTTTALTAGRLLGVPVVSKVLSAGPGGDVARLFTKPLGARRMRLTAKRVAAFVCLSASVEQELAEHGVPPERLRRIPNGVDVDHFRPPRDDERAATREALGLPVGEPLVLYCGRYEAAKRLDLILEAFRDVPGYILIVGEGDQENRLRALGSEPPLSGRVHLRPRVSDTAPLYRAADIYVSASHTEGMSGAVLEAMASALPVVATPASGMLELIGSGRGVLADDDSRESLARELGALTSDPQRRATIGGEARDFVSRGYSLEATADKLHALYRSLQ